MLSVNRRANDVRTLVDDWRSTGRTIGFVPTMGALHDGHGSLIKASLEQCDRTIVSVFVNPLQFEREDDLATYPRDDKKDQNFIEDLGANALFLPSLEEMYPNKQLTIVTQNELTDHLDGAARPGFFEGIMTVVLKLFHIVNPDVAFFGEKDYQQVAVIRRMVQDFNLNIEIRGMPTYREEDGLASSSRNQLLTPQARLEASKVYHSLKNLYRRFFAGENRVEVLLQYVRDELAEIPESRLGYATIVDPDNLTLRQSRVEVGDVCAIAVYLGEVRLIDNIVLDESRRVLDA